MASTIDHFRVGDQLRGLEGSLGGKVGSEIEEGEFWGRKEGGAPPLVMESVDVEAMLEILLARVVPQRTPHEKNSRISNFQREFRESFNSKPACRETRE